jgi:hypothetical protein
MYSHRELGELQEEEGQCSRGLLHRVALHRENEARELAWTPAQSVTPMKKLSKASEKCSSQHEKTAAKSDKSLETFHGQPYPTTTAAAPPPPSLC